MNPREELVAALEAQGVSDYEIGYAMGRRCYEAGHPPHPEGFQGSEQGYLDGYSEAARLS